MNSRSTYLRAQIGGLHGRALLQGDQLKFGIASTEAQRFINQLKRSSEVRSFTATKWSVGARALAFYNASPTVRAMPGAQFENFTKESRRIFFNELFVVSAQSDRMAYRLDGHSLRLSAPLELISAAVVNGTVQVPPDGNPLILLADRQTIGGYPKIAYVASVDLPLVAQMRAGAQIRFREITLAQAQALYQQRELDIQQLKQAIALSEK
jgi:antagonist of KipI